MITVACVLVQLELVPNVTMAITYQQMAVDAPKDPLSIAGTMLMDKINALDAKMVMDFQKVPTPLVFHVKKNALEAATLQISARMEIALMVSTSVMTTTRVLPVLLGALCASNSGTTVC